MQLSLTSRAPLITLIFSWCLGLMPVLVLTIPLGVHIASISLLLMATLVLLKQTGESRPLNTTEKIFIASLCALPLITALDCLFRGSAFRHVDYPLRFIAALPIFFALRRVQLNILPLCYGLYIGAIASGSIALYQSIGLGIDRVHGSTSIITFSQVSMLLSLLSLCSLFLYPLLNKISLLLCFFAALFGMTAALLSGMRGTWIALFPITILWICYAQINAKLKTLMTLGLLLSLFSLYSFNDQVHQRVNLAVQETNIYFEEHRNNTSVGVRWELWKGALLIFKDNPLFGIGSGNYRAAMGEKNTQGIVHMPIMFNHAHNAFLHYLATLGIPGALAYLLLLLGPSYYFLHNLKTARPLEQRFLGVSGLAIILSYMTYDLTGWAFAHQKSLLFFAIMLVTLAGLIQQKTVTKSCS